MDRRLAVHASEHCTFFSGYDCDSLALEGITGFVAHVLPFFRSRPRAWLELRTKSTHIEPLLAAEPFPRCVAAWSFTPEAVAEALEHRTPDVGRRIAAMAHVAERGWPVGLRLDPLVWLPGFTDHFRRLLERIFTAVPPDAVHSVSLGTFRLPRPFHRRLVRLHPSEPLLAGPLAERDGVVSYRGDLEAELLTAARSLVQEWIPGERIFACGGGQVGEAALAGARAPLDRRSLSLGAGS
jgi:spore photoproduct lyase